MGKSRIEYKRNWRQVEKKRKRCNAFIAEYTKIKFGNVYHEALSFYKALREMYPNKMDLKKTKEYQSWQKALENQEPSIIVQHLYTDVTHGENESKANSDTESENENSDTESQNKNDQNEPKASCDTESENENSDTESENSDTERQNSHTDQNSYRDNLVLEIPLENYLPTTNAEIPAHHHHLSMIMRFLPTKDCKKLLKSYGTIPSSETSSTSPRMTMRKTKELNFQP